MPAAVSDMLRLFRFARMYPPRMLLALHRAAAVYFARDAVLRTDAIHCIASGTS